jgi:phenylpropionate dioxygenase-like ring-hydroxylating dioxygenase large terminal subunit
VFVHQSQLEHLLSPRDYADEDVLQRERERLLLPSWHPVAARSELPRPGDFLTRDLLGEPLLVRNVDGEVCVYLNVCPHRHSRLRSEAKGHDPHFRCQYHGWEYQRDGRTGKIPDARSFRPFDRENARLVKFRTAAWGDLVFATLSDNGPSLAEQLGPMAGEGERLGSFRLAWTWRRDYEANWKIVVENTLESYHIDCLHKQTLGVMPTEEQSTHVLEDTYTTLRTPETYPWISAMQNVMVRALGGAVTNVYTHHVAHPHLWFISMDTMRLIQTVEPLSPTTSRHRAWLYTLDGTRRGPWAWLMRLVLRPIVVSTTRKILSEDAGVFPEIQRGLQSSRFRGIIGTREERVYAFQRYVRDRLA